MLKELVNKKSIFTIIIASFVIVLALLGSNWEIGQAGETVPTIPVIYKIVPESICVNSDDTVATITGSNFIDDIDGYYYTWVRWLGPEDLLPSYIIPDSINLAGTELIFTIDASKLTDVGAASLWVVNHPESTDPYEVAGPLYIEIIGCEFVYLPLIMK